MKKNKNQVYVYCCRNIKQQPSSHNWEELSGSDPRKHFMIENIEADPGQRKQEKYQKDPEYQDNKYILGENPVSHQPADSDNSYH